MPTKPASLKWYPMVSTSWWPSLSGEKIAGSMLNSPEALAEGRTASSRTPVWRNPRRLPHCASCCGRPWGGRIGALQAHPLGGVQQLEVHIVVIREEVQRVVAW